MRKESRRMADARDRVHAAVAKVLGADGTIRIEHVAKRRALEPHRERLIVSVARAPLPVDHDGIGFAQA